jgi:AAA domain
MMEATMPGVMNEFERQFREARERVKPSGRGNTDGAQGFKHTQKTTIKPFPFTLSKDITLEPKAFLIDGFLGRHETSAWYGPPDAGKSAVKIYAAACVAAGRDYCGRRVSQGPVSYVAAERGAIVKRRVKAWCHEHDLTDIPLAVIDHAIDLRTGKVDADRIVATADHVTTICGQPVTWIAFDTLNRVLAGGDENSPKDMGVDIASIDRIHRATRAHCSVVHHVPHDRTDRMRGHGLALGALDMTVRITKDATTVHVEVDKANDLVDRPAFAFAFKSVTLCTDPVTGVETTAPVMVPIGSEAGINSRRKPARLPKAAQTALRALLRAVDDVGRVPEASNHIPAATRVVSVDQWRQYAYSSGISASSESRARQQAFKRASEYLIGGCHVGIWNDEAWPIS